MTTTTEPTVLPPHKRGDTFRYRFRLGNDWNGAMFTGGVRFTLRTRIPGSAEVTDNPETNTEVIYAASSLGDDPEITFEDDEDTLEEDVWGVVVIADSASTTWPLGRLQWDVQCIVTSPRLVETPDSGEIMIRGDITRTP